MVLVYRDFAQLDLPLVLKGNLRLFLSLVFMNAFLYLVDLEVEEGLTWQHKASCERISSVSVSTSTYGTVIHNPTVCGESTRGWTRVYTLLINACFVQ